MATITRNAKSKIIRKGSTKMTEAKRKKLEIVREYAEERVDKLNKGMRQLTFNDASTMIGNKLLLCDMQDECDLWNRVCTLVKKELREW